MEVVAFRVHPDAGQPLRGRGTGAPGTEQQEHHADRSPGHHAYSADLARDRLPVIDSMSTRHTRTLARLRGSKAYSRPA